MDYIDKSVELALDLIRVYGNDFNSLWDNDSENELYNRYYHDKLLYHLHAFDCFELKLDR